MGLLGGLPKSKKTMSFIQLVVIFFIVAVVSYNFLDVAIRNMAFFKASSGCNPVQQVVDNESEELARVLKRAATPDKTVIVTSINEAWAAPGSLFELMLESLRNGNNTERLITHLVVVSFDEKAHARCLTMNLNCFFLQVQGFNFSEGEAFFGTNNYYEIIWRKVDLLHSILSLGYNFLFTDTDIMWFRDPFMHLQDEEVDFQVSCDKYNGRPRDHLTNLPNTGIMHVKSNKRTIHFFELWYHARRLYKGKHEQEVFDIIKFSDVMNITGLKVKYLDTELFGGICNPSTDLSRVCSMHTNCCVGLGPKIHDLRLILEDWKNFWSLTSPLKPSNKFTWSAPKQCYFDWSHNK